MRQAPYAQRSSRAQLDVALAAAALELPLEIYFIGDGLWQLATGRDPDAAWLPPGLKGWAAISGMTRAHFFAESECRERLAEAGVEWLVPFESLDLASMAHRWRSCRQVMAL